MLVRIDTSPLHSGHEHRGIGLYTKLLVQELSKQSDISITTAPNADRQPDVIHYPFFDLFFATLPLRKLAPTVVTIHDVIPLQFPQQYKPGIKGQFRFLRQKLALGSVAAVITDSQASKQSIIEHLGIADNKINVVYLAGNPEIKPVSQLVLQQTRLQYALPKEYLFYVGDINYNKNIPELIKMISLLPEKYSLVLAGKHFISQPIPEWQAIETAVNHYSVGKRVLYIPELGDNPSQTLAALYQQANAYVQPSLAEGFGLPVLEAFQVGTPVLSSNTTSLPEIGGEVALYSDPSGEALAKVFLESIATWNQTERARFQDKAADWLHQFSWQKAAQATKHVYESLL